MKAYKVYDRTDVVDYVMIVFAENRGKAICAALNSDEFSSDYFHFTWLGAVRVPELDKFYRGRSFMDWYDDTDRLTLVRDAHFHCDDDSFDPDECEKCCAKDYCVKYEDYLYGLQEEEPHE